MARTFTLEGGRGEKGIQREALWHPPGWQQLSLLATFYFHRTPRAIPLRFAAVQSHRPSPAVKRPCPPQR